MIWEMEQKRRSEKKFQELRVETTESTEEQLRIQLSSTWSNRFMKKLKQVDEKLQDQSRWV